MFAAQTFHARTVFLLNLPSPVKKVYNRIQNCICEILLYLFSRLCGPWEVISPTQSQGKKRFVLMSPTSAGPVAVPDSSAQGI